MPTADDLRREAAARITREQMLAYAERKGWGPVLALSGLGSALYWHARNWSISWTERESVCLAHLERIEERPWWLIAADILGEDPAALLGLEDWRSAYDKVVDEGAKLGEAFETQARELSEARKSLVEMIHAFAPRMTMSNGTRLIHDGGSPAVARALRCLGLAGLVDPEECAAAAMTASTKGGTHDQPR